MATIGFERHLHLAKVEQAAGLAFGFPDVESAAPASRSRLLWLGSMTSAVVGLIAVAAVYTGF